MSRTILVAYDGSPQAEKALAYADDHHNEDDLILLMVLDPIDGFVDAYGHSAGHYEGWIEEAEDEAQELLDDAAASIDHGGTVTTEHVIGQAPRSIIEYTEDNDIDQIVIGSHGRTGIGRILLGSVAEQVVRRAGVPVTVVR